MQPIVTGNPAGEKSGIGKAEADVYLGFGFDIRSLPDFAFLRHYIRQPDL
jgi:hypothetical protein